MYIKREVILRNRGLVHLEAEGRPEAAFLLCRGTSVFSLKTFN